LHPQYEIAAGRLDKAVRDIERLKSDYEQTKDAAERQSIEGLLRQLDAAAILAADEAVNVNVAVIDVAKDIPAALTCAESRTGLGRVGQRLTLVGHPLSSRDVLVDPNTPYRLSSAWGGLQHIESPADAAVPGRWLVGFDDPLKDENWSGSAILDSNGQVVGVYSRPTPPLPGISAGAIVTHDVTVAESLHALMKSTFGAVSGVPVESRVAYWFVNRKCQVAELGGSQAMWPGLVQPDSLEQIHKLFRLTPQGQTFMASPKPPPPDRKPSATAKEPPLPLAAQETKRPTDSTPVGDGDICQTADEVRPLPGRKAAGSRRHGGGVPGPGYAARTARGAQDPETLGVWRRQAAGAP